MTGVSESRQAKAFIKQYCCGDYTQAKGLTNSINASLQRRRSLTINLSKEKKSSLTLFMTFCPSKSLLIKSMTHFMQV